MVDFDGHLLHLITKLLDFVPDIGLLRPDAVEAMPVTLVKRRDEGGQVRLEVNAEFLMFSGLFRLEGGEFFVLTAVEVREERRDVRVHLRSGGRGGRCLSAARAAASIFKHDAEDAAGSCRNATPSGCRGPLRA